VCGIGSKCKFSVEQTTKTSIWSPFEHN